MKIDFQEIYRERIKIIDKQIQEAVFNKQWTKKAKLEAEKANLQERIK
ncbi:hypothetical protein [uncultured Clostridium sp.]|nr:hypothetical protein [uncultured Clostridium sp.]